MVSSLVSVINDVEGKHTKEDGKEYTRRVKRRISQTHNPMMIYNCSLSISPFKTPQICPSVLDNGAN